LIAKRLKALGLVSDDMDPRCIVYPPDAAGHHWFANALFQAMADTVAIENGWLEEIRTLLHRSRSPIRDFYTANMRQHRTLRGGAGAQPGKRARLELTQVLAELERKHSHTPTRLVVRVSVPVCTHCWTEFRSDDTDRRSEADVRGADWPDRLVWCGLSAAAVSVVKEQLAHSQLHVFCHGPCHRALIYGRDDVYVSALPFGDYCAALLRGADDIGRSQGEKWMRSVIFRASGGRCARCRTRLSWEHEEITRSTGQCGPNLPLSPQLVCRGCEAREAPGVSQVEVVTIHHPLTPEIASSW
jgi:hypothetical protein